MTTLDVVAGSEETDTSRSLQSLPAPVLGIIARLLPVATRSRRSSNALAALNLTSRAAHEALPHAFSHCGDPPADSDAQEACSGDLADDADERGPMAACAHWWSRSASPSLRLDLDRVHASRLALPSLAASLSAWGQRYAHAARLALTFTQPSSLLTARLFLQHAAPHMVCLRQLSVHAPDRTDISPLLARPEFAGLTQRVWNLSMTGHHTAVAALAGRLHAACPAVTALEITLCTDPTERPEEMSLPEPCAALTIHAPPALRTLCLTLWGDENEALFSVEVLGRPPHLHTLNLHTWDCDDERSWRPFTLAGPLPALRLLDATASPSGAHTVRMLQRLTVTCPALVTLVMRCAPFQMLLHASCWHAAFEAMAPMAGCLRLVELRFSKLWRRSGNWAAQVQLHASVGLGLSQAAAEFLPHTQVKLPGP